MTLCPIAIIATCRKCAVFNMCPLKGVIGDHKEEASPPAGQSTDQKQDNDKP